MDLKLATTEELLSELLNRCDHAIFMGIRVKNPHGDSDKEIGAIDTIRRWIGNSFTCAGLCASLSRSVLQDFADREEPLKEEEF